MISNIWNKKWLFYPFFLFAMFCIYLHVVSCAYFVSSRGMQILVGLLVVLLPSEYFIYVKICMLTHDILIHPNKGVRSPLWPHLDSYHCISSANINICSQDDVKHFKLVKIKTEPWVTLIVLVLTRNSLKSSSVSILTRVPSHPLPPGTGYTMSWHPCSGKNKAISRYWQVGQFHHQSIICFFQCGSEVFL